MPSAKYSWSGSFDRLLKGRTTIDRRGADLASVAGGRCTLVTTGACAVTVDEFPLGQTHQTAVPMPIAATMPAISIASRERLRRLGPMSRDGAATSGNDLTEAALNS